MRSMLKGTAAVVFLSALGLVGFGYYLTTIDVDPTKRPERQMSAVWADFPFDSHYVSVNGSRLHYVDEGDPNGPVYLLLHGNPTSSYLWRKVIPKLANAGGRVIALDNIGFGASDRPDINYSFDEHSRYLDGFIEKLDLKDVTLVLHDWGSGLGFDYARRNEQNVSAIVFMEAILGVPSMAQMDAATKMLFGAIRTEGTGEIVVLAGNFFVEQLIPQTVVRELDDDEMAAYREPFASFGSRRPTLAWPREIPFDGNPKNVAEKVESYADWLKISPIPKLLLYFEPGTLVNKSTVERISDEWAVLDTQFLGDGIHFVQEDKGEEIAAAIVVWQTKRLPLNE